MRINSILMTFWQILKDSRIVIVCFSFHAGLHVQCRPMQAYVLSRLDYGNAVLMGLPAYLYNRLQSVLNAAARYIAGLRRSDHITDTLASFHWLKVPERIQFKLATIVYRSLSGTAPRYLAADLRRLTCRPDDVWDRHSLTSSMSVSRSVQLLETELSLWLVLDYETVCHMTSSRVTHCHISVVDSKHFNLDSNILLFCFSS